MENHATLTKRKKKTVIYLILLVIGVLLLTVLLWYQGIIIPNARGANEYSIKGIDVSAYQGEIEWNQIQEQDMRFAFIKATEGSLSLINQKEKDQSCRLIKFERLLCK